MLILLNQELIDVSDPFTTVQGVGGAPTRGVPTVGQAVLYGQDAAFAAQGIENANENVRMTLACLIALSGPANCAIFLYQPNMKSPREVAVRFGAAPIDTLVYLLSAHEQGRLSPGLINRHIWAVAGAPAA